MIGDDLDNYNSTIANVTLHINNHHLNKLKLKMSVETVKLHTRLNTLRAVKVEK